MLIFGDSKEVENPVRSGERSKHSIKKCRRKPKRSTKKKPHTMRDQELKWKRLNMQDGTHSFVHNPPYFQVFKGLSSSFGR